MKSIFYRIVGLMLIAFSSLVWAWMLGAFSRLSEVGVGVNTAQWFAPGILSMPATVAVVAGKIGVLFLFGFPQMFSDEKKGAS